MKAIVVPSAMLCGECGQFMLSRPESGAFSWKPGERMAYRCLNRQCAQHEQDMFWRPPVIDLEEE